MSVISTFCLLKVVPLAEAGGTVTEFRGRAVFTHQWVWPKACRANSRFRGAQLGRTLRRDKIYLPHRVRACAERNCWQRQFGPHCGRRFFGLHSSVLHLPRRYPEISHNGPRHGAFGAGCWNFESSTGIFCCIWSICTVNLPAGRAIVQRKGVLIPLASR